MNMTHVSQMTGMKMVSQMPKMIKNGTMMNGSHKMSMNSHSKMPMYFNFNNDFYMLLESLLIKTPTGIFGCCVVFFILTVLYEFIKTGREYLLYNTALKKRIYKLKSAQDRLLVNGRETLVTPNGDNEAPVSPETNNDVEVVLNKPFYKKIDIHQYNEFIFSKKWFIQRCNRDHLIQSILHLVQTLVSYILMLAFMTFNVWVCLSILFGSMIGYFIFGWRKSQLIDNLDHCH